MIWLVFSFFVAALCYSSAGFGGGSSYAAILALKGVEPGTIRQVSLLCNVVVVSIGGLAGWRSIRRDLILPLLVGALPLVYLTAQWQLSGPVFSMILASALLISGIILLTEIAEAQELRKVGRIQLSFLGAMFGALAGLTGIGGGIYLAPALYFMRAARAHEIASVVTCFILVNSVLGLLVLAGERGWDGVAQFGWLPVVVACGGILGSSLLRGYFHELSIRRVTSLLVLFVALRLFLTI